MNRIVQCFLFCFAALLFIACGSTTRETTEREIGIRVTTSGEIERGYETYTFFLSPSAEYAHSANAEAVEKLERKFDEFGRNIGDANLAVLPVNIRGKFDYFRSKEILDQIYTRYPKLNLSYNGGPFVVVLNHHLDDPVATEDAVVAMSFYGVAPPRIVEGLNYIEEGIRRKQIFDKNVDFYEAWLKVKNWLDGVDVVELKNFVIDVIRLFT